MLRTYDKSRCTRQCQDSEGKETRRRKKKKKEPCRTGSRGNGEESTRVESVRQFLLALAKPGYRSDNLRVKISATICDEVDLDFYSSNHRARHHVFHRIPHGDSCSCNNRPECPAGQGHAQEWYVTLAGPRSPLLSVVISRLTRFPFQEKTGMILRSHSAPVRA